VRRYLIALLVGAWLGLESNRWSRPRYLTPTTYLVRCHGRNRISVYPDRPLTFRRGFEVRIPGLCRIVFWRF